MALSAGSKLGPYEIQSPLGAGGMGEVYKARDTRLDRTVAVKILAAHLSSSQELKQRFEHEARTVSSLNHAHICQLFDVGSQDGTDYLVMEFLEGETLAERLRKGPLPLPELLRLGTEIAKALEVAHRAGIIHRDLKPANIMLTKAGAKLMDFGLAKPSALGAPGSGSAPLLSAARTVSGPSPMSPLTTAGSIVGTIQYMSPEQIEGLPADARSDVFAFGAVLYEMATGKRAFEGKSQISVASAILEKDPEPIGALQPLTPPGLEHVVRRALEKNPDDRWQAASDIRGELQWIAESGLEAGLPAAASGPHSQRRDRLAWGVAAVLFVLAALAGAAYWRLSSHPATRIASTILPPSGGTFNLTSANGPPALSPDGSMLAFVAIKDGHAAIWLRPLASMEAKQLPGTEGAFAPFWSPDGRYLAYFNDGKLLKVAAEGGPPETVCTAADARGGSWGTSGFIVFAPTRVDSIYKVPASGGTPVQVTHNATDFPTGPSSHRWPWFLPDGQHFLYAATPTGSQSSDAVIRMASLDGKGNAVVLRASSNPVYVSGRLLYEQDGTLMAAPFDAARGSLTGEATPVAQNVQFDANFVQGSFAASAGVLVYEMGPATVNRELVWFDRTGKQLGTLGDPAIYGAVRISPDGKHVAVVVLGEGGNNRDIWIYDVARGIRTRLTFGQGLHVSPVWSPDGKYVYYLVPTQGIYRKAADGSGQEEQILATTKLGSIDDISPDGKYLTASADANIMVVPLTGDAKPFLYHKTSFLEIQSAFSPDGKWLAYTSTESGRAEVYVSTFPQAGSKWQVSTAGGVFPLWSRDGKTLFYSSASSAPHDLMAVRLEAQGKALRIGAPQKLFTLAPFTFGSDVAPDGRFLIGQSGQQSSPEPLTLRTDWTAELKK